MSKHKNFTINRRDPNDSWVTASLVSIGDMFEREGSIHIKVNCCNTLESSNKITICNLNTGSVWEVPDTEQYRRVKNCTLQYELKSK